MLKIYGRANSSNVRKVLWTCGEIGLDFEREDWGRGFRPASDPVYRALNPFERVPTVSDDGYIMRESHAIIRYLAAKHERRDLYPDDLKLRVVVDTWMDWVGSEIGAPMRTVFHGMVVKAPGYESAAMIAKAQGDWNKLMGTLDGELGKGPFVAGETFTLGDICVGVCVHRWCSLEFDKPRLAGIEAYYQRLCERRPFQTYLLIGQP